MIDRDALRDFYDGYYNTLDDVRLDDWPAFFTEDRAGIPAGAVLDTMELQNDKTFEERGIMQVMHHPVHRDFKMPGWPVRVDGKPPAIRSSPVLGEHTEAVLTEWLGLNAVAVETLRAEGAV